MKQGEREVRTEQRRTEERKKRKGEKETEEGKKEAFSLELI